ncbi:putative LRR receptor-like serine/threonine-protein kinase, partial [Camellia lanceoleosa]
LWDLVIGDDDSKGPTNSMFGGDLNLHNFARMALPDHVIEIVDPILLSNNKEEEEAPTNLKARQVRNASTMEKCVTIMVNIGVACSMESP